MKRALLVLGVLGVTILTGCVAPRPSLYGLNANYPEAMYLYLQEDVDLMKQMELMNNYFNVTAEQGKKPAPGAYAHMALLHSKNGDMGEALKYFNKEKEAFPESASYIDFLINSFNKSTSSKKGRK